MYVVTGLWTHLRWREKTSLSASKLKHLHTFWLPPMGSCSGTDDVMVVTCSRRATCSPSTKPRSCVGRIIPSDVGWMDGWIRLIVGFQSLMVISPTASCWCVCTMYWTRLVLVRPATSLYSASPLKHHPTGKQSFRCRMQEALHIYTVPSTATKTTRFPLLSLVFCHMMGPVKWYL